MKPKAQTARLCWDDIQNELADHYGLAIVVEDERARIVAKSNNNSICEHLYASAQFAPHCAEYCGRAFENAWRAGETVRVKCHADLNFMAVPIETEEKRFVVIVGRSFVVAEDYRTATKRAASGDWQQFPLEDFFSNALISASVDNVESLAGRFEKLNDGEKRALLDAEKNALKLPEEIESILNDEPDRADGTLANREENIAASGNISASESINVKDETNATADNKTSLNQPKTSEPDDLKKYDLKDAAGEKRKEIEELSAWRSLFGALLKLEYAEACELILEFFSNRYGFSNLAWLARREDALEIMLAGGEFKNQRIRFSIQADDARLLEAVENNTSLDFRERQPEGETGAAQTIRLFPFAVGGEARGAVIVGDRLADENIKRRLSLFMRQIAPELEILRLRDEVARQSALADAAQRFSQSLNRAQTEDFWDYAARASAEILQSERGSLMVYDETAQQFVVKAAIGNHADIIRQEKIGLGEKVARSVLLEGEPLLIEDVRATNIAPAPAAWKYKTDSFISYPIIIDDQKIGVLNLTDKVDGTPYDEFDLKLVDAFAPQLAVVLDRTDLKRKAGELERLSVTDPLTGLRNRRYLEERLAEEVRRTQRHGYAMSFMMIDVDEFKSYNDSFTHPEGDKALQMVGRALRATLRGADVAARYGGEEFSILLPQTTVGEAHTIAERIRERVERTTFPHRQVTVSLGVAACSPTLCTAPALISAADKALYRAKRQGRNSVRIYSELDDE